MSRLKTLSMWTRALDGFPLPGGCGLPYIRRLEDQRKISMGGISESLCGTVFFECTG